jgi:signal transduction histidine kinase
MSPLYPSAARLYYRVRRLILTHALVTDAVLALLVAVVSTPWLITTQPGPGSWVLQAGLLVPLVWRRRYPCGVFAVICAVALVQLVAGVELVADLSLLVALSTVATYRSRQVALCATAILEVGAVLASVRWGLAGSWLRSLVFLSGLNAAGLLLGVSLRARRALVASLTERADRLERERDQQALISAAAERTRIAREMHDVIGHRLAVIVSLADGAAAKLTSDPPRAAAALDSLAEVGRQALGEARGLLGVLRADVTGPDVRGAGTAGDGLAPQPDLARLADLVAQTRATGLTATVDCQGDPAGLPAGLELAVYRIAQEAITNTLKHAITPETVAISVIIGDTGIDIAVTDDGQSAGPPGHDGHGLAGMRERAQAYGGWVKAGPERDGWAVRAHLRRTAPDGTVLNPGAAAQWVAAWPAAAG